METDRVKEIVCAVMNLPAEMVKDDASLRDDLLMDSLDRYQIILRVEEAFDVEIPDEEALRADSVAALAALLGKNS